MNKKTLYSNSAERPNNRTSLFKQLHLVKTGTYLVTHILKPTQEYLSATVSTRDFCVREKVEDWEVIRVGLIESWQNGDLIAIEFDGKRYSYVSIPNPKPKEIGYIKTEYGTKLTYPKDEPLFFPSVAESTTKEQKIKDLGDAI